MCIRDRFGEAEASTPSGLYGRGSNKFTGQPARPKSFPPNHNAAPAYFVSENNVEESPVVNSVEEAKALVGKPTCLLKLPVHLLYKKTTYILRKSVFNEINSCIGL